MTDWVLSYEFEWWHVTLFYGAFYALSVVVAVLWFRIFVGSGR